MCVWSRRITADAAFWGIVSGFAFNVGPKGLEYLGWVELPFWLDPILLGALVSLIVVLVVSRFGTVSPEEQEFRRQMHKVPDKELSTVKLRITRYAPLLLATYSVSMFVILVRIYLRPYQEATGTLAASGGIDWTTGEALLVLGGPLVVVPTAWIAWRMINKTYG